VKPRGAEQRAEPSPARDKGEASAGDGSVWARVFERDNLYQALKRVEGNGGAPGTEGMVVQELRSWLKEHGQEVRAALDAGSYWPSPVRRVEIPKPRGAVKQLGIPTVLDRLIQQAMAQVLTPLFDPRFSRYSYGFRPGRRAHDAVKAAQEYIREGYDWAVDIDLEKFFDRVNHDKLMARVVRVVKDRQVRKLIRRYLTSGVMVNVVLLASEEGTPQGGPLSPLLANIMLDDLDKELERRGQRFVRYADDCNIYVRSRRAGEWVLASVRRYLSERLSLKVNEEKSTVDWPWKLKFLGFSFYKQKGTVIVRVATATLNRFRDKLRQLVWKRWKRGKTRWRELVKLGVPARMAGLGAVQHGPWRMAASPVVTMALSNAYWQKQGLSSITERYHQLRGT
jgi:RNA-directed DNA polymerase